MNTVRRCFSLWLIISSLCAAYAAHADPVTDRAAGTQPCTVKTRSDHVVIMVCPRGLSRDAWQSAGQSACEPDKRCNVWIWDDAGHAPQIAPATDAELPRKLTAVAVAVWINTPRNLIILSRVRE